MALLQLPDLQGDHPHPHPSTPHLRMHTMIHLALFSRNRVTGGNRPHPDQVEGNPKTSCTIVHPIEVLLIATVLRALQVMHLL